MTSFRFTPISNTGDQTDLPTHLPSFIKIQNRSKKQDTQIDILTLVMDGMQITKLVQMDFQSWI